MFVYIIDHIYFTNNGSTKIMSMSFCTVFIQAIRGRPGGLSNTQKARKSRSALRLHCCPFGRYARIGLDAVPG